MRRTLVRGLATVLTASVLAVLPLGTTASADGWADRRCDPKVYKTNYRIVSSTKAPKLTHIGTFAVGPGGTRQMSRTLERQTQVTAGVTYSAGGSVEAGLPGKVLGKASATVNLSLAASGSRTWSGKQTVTDTVTNNTRRNVQYVFYKGVTKANGAFRKYTCSFYYLPGVSYGYYRVHYRTGNWRSYAIPGEGAVRCGSGTTGLGALARTALRLGCPA